MLSKTTDREHKNAEFRKEFCVFANINIFYKPIRCVVKITVMRLGILVRVSSEGLKLSTLFPNKSIAQIGFRVAVSIIMSYLWLFVKKNPQRRTKRNCAGEDSSIKVVYKKDMPTENQMHNTPIHNTENITITRAMTLFLSTS